MELQVDGHKCIQVRRRCEGVPQMVQPTQRRLKRSLVSSVRIKDVFRSGYPRSGRKCRLD
jgi:hypothetical protein